MVILTDLMPLSANCHICINSRSVSIDWFFSSLCVVFALFAHLVFFLDTRHDEFHFLGCWIFLYVHWYVYALFWSAVKLLGNNLILVDLAFWESASEQGLVSGLLFPTTEARSFWNSSMPCELWGFPVCLVFPTWYEVWQFFSRPRVAPSLTCTEWSAESASFRGTLCRSPPFSSG